MRHVARSIAAMAALGVLAVAAVVSFPDRPADGRAAEATPTAAPAVARTAVEPLDTRALRAPPVSDPARLVIHGSGWGHGVGMSQYGAQAQALAGWSHEEILAHYYPGTEIARTPEVEEHIRVNLFSNRGDVDPARLLVRTSSVGGGAPDRPVEVTLGDGDPVEVPWPQTWQLTSGAGAGELVLTDNRGRERRRAQGPARIRYQFTGGAQTLLRLPQLVNPRTSTSRLGGTFAWGEVEVTQSAGRLQPVAILPLERYLRGIAEVPSRWEPAALQAQALAARTYAVRQMRQPMGATCRCHLGATPHHQVYAGYVKEGVEGGHRWTDAVDATTGEVVVYDGQLAWTYYSSSHGGRSEHSEDSWAYDAAVPYLRSVDDPWSLDESAGNPNASWTRTVGNAELASLVGGGLAEVRGVRVLERTAGDSPTVLEVRGVDDDGEPVRLRWDGRGAGAGTALKRHFGALLPSQQIDAIGLEPFHDDAGRAGEYELLVAHRSGLVRGCDEGRRLVCPGEAVSRGEVAIALVRAVSGAAGTLQDIGAAVRFGDPEEALETAVDAGWLEPCEGGCADEPVTRAQLAAALRSALEADAAPPPHADAGDHEHAGAVGAVATRGWMPGCGPERFCPDDRLARHDLAVALVRAFELT